MTTVKVTLPIAELPNSNTREHWARTAEKRRDLRLRAKLAARHCEPLTPPVTVDFLLVWPDNRRRDSANFETKGFVDGLVDAGLIPDDSDKFIRHVQTAGIVDADHRAGFVTIVATILCDPVVTD